MPPETLADRLKRARITAGVTQVQLADRLRRSGDERFASTDGTRIGDWENRTPRLPFYVVDHLAHALGVPLDSFSEFATPPAAGAGQEPSQGLLEELSDLEQQAESLAARLRRARAREQP
jgi:transcriptional regulator with XRE-family HTH domain